MEFKDYYKTMGLARDASQEDIKRAYRKLARKYHPDVSKEPGAETRFKEIGEAYEVLKDPEKRAAYDQLGTSWRPGQEFRPPPDWNQGFEFRGGGFTDRDASSFSDFFESLFGRQFGQARGGHARGEDSHAKVIVDLEDAYRGAERTVNLRSTRLDANGRPEVTERTLNVRIPKGIRPGQHIRLAGQGGAGSGRGASGDLYLEVEFRPHGIYRVEGRDVYLDLPVTPWEVALGAAVKVPSPAGVFEIKVPPGSNNGQKFRLKGKGIPGNPSGDLYAVLQVAVPAARTDAERALYEKMAKELAFNPRTHLGV